MRSCKDRTFQKHISGDLQDQTPLLSDMAGHMLHTASSRMLITLSQFHQSWIHDLPSKNLGAPGGACKPSPPLVPVATYTRPSSIINPLLLLPTYKEKKHELISWWFYIFREFIVLL